MLLISRLHNFDSCDEPVVNIVGLQLRETDHHVMVTAGEDAHHVAGRDHVVSTSYFNTGTVLVSKQILVPQVILSILYTYCLRMQVLFTFKSAAMISSIFTLKLATYFKA